MSKIKIEVTPKLKADINQIYGHLKAYLGTDLNFQHPEFVSLVKSFNNYKEPYLKRLWKKYTS